MFGIFGSREFFVRDTHRALWYEDGVMVRVLGAGRYEIKPRPSLAFLRAWLKRPLVEVTLVDVRERDLTIKGQEILTADKVAIRVSIIVQFRVADPKAAIHAVTNYEDRLYSDVQLAARRSLASMTLEKILTDRNRLSEDILRDMKEAAGGYGVTILRADVKDLVFPGNLQEIMNKVLAAERLSQASLVDARTKADVQRIESQAKAESQKLEAESRALAVRAAAEAAAESRAIAARAEHAALQEKAKGAALYAQHKALLRLEELDALRDLARNGEARIYLGFDRKFPSEDGPAEK